MSQKQSKKSNKDLVLEFTNFLKFKKGLSANTISAYESDVTQFLKFTGENIIKFDDLNYWFVLQKLLYKFHAEHPKLYSKYYGWCSYHKINLPKDIYLKFLDSNTFKDIEKIFYKQI